MELSPLGTVELVLMLGVFERNSRDGVRSLASLSGENRNRSEDQHHSPSCLGFELCFNLFFIYHNHCSWENENHLGGLPGSSVAWLSFGYQ